MKLIDSFSGKALLFCMVVSFITAFYFYPRWEKKDSESTLSWDASGYYMYLPALFIYKDIKKCSFRDTILQKYRPTPDFQQAYFHEPSGNFVMKYSSGQALVELPFFAFGHAWALLSDTYPEDGFSFPYQASIGIGMFLFSLIGLYYLRKILILFFSELTVGLLLIMYVIGTNYINYSAVDQAMTHSTLFTIYCLIIWNSIQFYKDINLFRAGVIGLLCGLATLIRPTDIISVLIPVFWGVNSVETCKERFQWAFSNLKFIVVAAATFAVMVMIQPIYWKYATGEWIVYSYGDQGFSWLKPHLYDYLLSFRCGWWRFTPLMVLPFLGMIIYDRDKPSPWLMIGFGLLSLYIVTAWDVWDYGGTAGRAMVQYYPVLAFPLSALIEKVMNHSILRWVFSIVFLVLSYLSVWWVYHAHGGQVQALELSRKYYWNKVGRWTADDEDKKMLDNKHVFEGSPINMTEIYKNDFEQDTSANAVIKNGTKKIRMARELQFSPEYVIENTGVAKKWMRFTALFDCTHKEWDLWRQTQFTVRFYNGDKEIQTNMIRLQRFIHDGQSHDIFMDAKVPETWTNAKIFLWHADSDKEIFMDNLRVVTFDE
jgi:hypothetical protein